MNILIDGQTLHTAELNRGIGTYFKEMIEAMLAGDFVHTFFITTDDEEALSCFSDFARNKLKAVIHPQFNPSYLLTKNREEAPSHYTVQINKICQEKAIDIYWNPNPQMDNTLLPRKLHSINTAFVATIYDLIPIIMKKVYYAQWPEFIQKEYLNKIKVLRAYNHLFPISQSTQKDVTRIIKIPENKVTIALCGVSKKFKCYPFPKVQASEPYVLYLGGFDPRKNMFKAIDAFSVFMSKYNATEQSYKLYLVCQLDEEARAKLEAYAKEKNILQNLVLTGFVEDRKLLRIYQGAQCFFFPSVYEGFGLPILEALSSGLPIACANNSSLPEVAGKHGNYFDAKDSEQMAQALKQALQQSNDLDAREKRNLYATQFSWKAAAHKLLTKILSLKSPQLSTTKKKIAWVSPLPPQRSGISNYSLILLRAMRESAVIDVYYDGVKPNKEIKNSFRALPLKDLEKNFTKYDEVIYHLGNNTEFHTNIYKLAWQHPSTIVIHDWNIHPFMQRVFLNQADHSYYEQAMEIYGAQGANELEKIKQRGHPDIWKFPMIDAIAKKSKRVIVHHQWVKEQLEEKSNVDVIPLFSYIENEPSFEEIDEFRGKFKLSKKDYLIATFGDVNNNKLPDVQIQAVKKLIDLGYPIKLIFVGKIQADTIIFFDQLKETKYEDKIFATDYLLDSDFIRGIYASDLVINLRNPSMGEASLTLAEALYASKPVIIGNSNQYKEFPDEIVAGKINYDGSEISQLIEQIKKCIENPLFKNLIEKRAKTYSENILNVDKITRSYLGYSK
jgi:glycosyltransferase involved in cell wall biosynthesis